MKQSLVLILCCFLSACTTEAPNAPICRVKSHQLDSAQGNAGCIVRVGQRLLTLKHKYSQSLDIPGGTANEHESAQCTAHRETWEETGFNVEVGHYLGTLEGGFRLYRCELDDDFGGELTKFPVPDWTSEASSIQLTEPFSTTHKDWRYPDQLVQIREAFVAAGQEN